MRDRFFLFLFLRTVFARDPPSLPPSFLPSFTSVLSLATVLTYRVVCRIADALIQYNVRNRCILKSDTVMRNLRVRVRVQLSTVETKTRRGRLFNFEGRKSLLFTPLLLYLSKYFHIEQNNNFSLNSFRVYVPRSFSFLRRIE